MRINSLAIFFSFLGLLLLAENVQANEVKNNIETILDIKPDIQTIFKTNFEQEKKPLPSDACTTYMPDFNTLPNGESIMGMSITISFGEDCSSRPSLNEIQEKLSN